MFRAIYFCILAILILATLITLIYQTDHKTGGYHGTKVMCALTFVFAIGGIFMRKYYTIPYFITPFHL